jgi:hypothetical protein
MIFIGHSILSSGDGNCGPSGTGSRCGSGITNVVFEDGGTEPLTIRESGFGSNIANLTTIEFPGRLTNLGDTSCPHGWPQTLTSVVFNEGDFPFTITNGQFTDCTNLAGTIDLPSNTVLVTNGAFSRMSISDFTIADGGAYALTINNSAFSNTSVSGSVNLPSNTTLLTASGFSDANIGSLLFADGGTRPLEISSGVFGRTNISGNVNFPANTQLITTGAFSESSLTSISFADGGAGSLTIGEGAFQCNDLSGTITFPANLVGIDAFAFWRSPASIACATGFDNEGLEGVIFTNPGGDSMVNVHAEAFRPGISFLNSCSTGITPVPAIIEFLGPDGTPLLVENDFGCGMQIQDPGLSLDGWALNGWHLNSDFSDPALTFPWVPFTGPVVVDDLLVYGNWAELSEVSVSLPVGSALVGETIAVTVYADYADGSSVDVTSQISELTSVDLGTGLSDLVEGNMVTFLRASTHEICASFQGVTGCSTIEVTVGDGNGGDGNGNGGDGENGGEEGPGVPDTAATGGVTERHVAGASASAIVSVLVMVTGALGVKLYTKYKKS